MSLWANKNHMIGCISALGPARETMKIAREKKVFRANKDDDDEQGNDALALTFTRSVCVLCLSWALAGS